MTERRSPRRAIYSALTIAAAALAVSGCGSTPLDVVNLGSSDAATILDAGTELPPQRPDVVAHWSFDEGTGIIAHDDSGNSYHGHLVGGTWVTGRFGGGLAFSMGDYVAVNGFQDPTPAWTISVWMRFSSRDITGSWGAVLSTELDAQGGWQVYLEGNAPFVTPRLNFSHARPGTNIQAIGCCTTLQPDAWYHVTVVADAAAGTVLFYQGTALTANANLVATLTPGDPTLYMGISVGASPDSGGLLSGTIDDVSIFSRPLSIAEIAALDVAPLRP